MLHDRIFNNYTISYHLPSLLVLSVQAKERLGDANYDEYIARIPGLPRPSWHLDQMRVSCTSFLYTII